MGENFFYLLNLCGIICMMWVVFLWLFVDFLLVGVIMVVDMS